MQLHQTTIFWLFIALTAGGFFLSCALWCIAKKRADTPGSPAKIRSLARSFHERVEHFTIQVRTLDEHANEYTSIFSSDDWDNLVQTVSRLEQVNRQIQELLRAKRFDSVAELLNDFHGVSDRELDNLQASLDSYRVNSDWEQHVHGMLKRVVCNLEAATHETKELSRTVTSRKRQPTLVTLADVKKTLLEDEAIRRYPQRAPKP